jgi:hypothetical protein
MSALIWAKVSGIVYGVSIKDLKKPDRSMINLSCREIIKRSPWKIKIKGGVLKEECLKLYHDGIRKLIKKFRIAKHTGWKNIEREFLEKRIEWFEENKNEILNKLKGNDVEKAYRLILMKIGIKKNEAPIVKKIRE